jgi:hypothetical protein
MKYRTGLLLLAFASIVSLGVSCKSNSGEDKTVSIDKVGFYIGTCTTDYWSSGASIKPYLAYYFKLYFSGDIAASDVEYARVYLPNGSTHYWTFDLANGFDAANKYIYGNGFCGSGNTMELPIGTMRAEIKLADGKSSTYDFTMGIPGNTSPGSYSYVYSADDETNGSSSYAPALRRPSVTSFANSGSAITVGFAANGSNVHNGWVWFYTSSGTYVGAFYYFLDPTTGAVSPKLSGGFQAAGANTLSSIAAGDIRDSSENSISASTFSTIAKCRVVVCDGLQYAASGKYANYDYRAMSAFYP